MSIHEIRARENPFSGHAEDDMDVDHRFVYASGFRRMHQYSTPSIRDEEIRAILRGVERTQEVTDREAQAFYLLNRRLIVLGVVVLGALLGGIFFYKVGMPPVLYVFPVGLSFIYALLITISEFRLSRWERRK